jgi:hypothetical protein
VFDSLELGAIVVQLDGETESNVDAGWLLKNRRYQTALTCFSQGVDVGKVCVLTNLAMCEPPALHSKVRLQTFE